MNLQSILLSVLIAAIVIGVIIKRVTAHHHRKNKCETCQDQGCTLRDLLNKNQA